MGVRYIHACRMIWYISDISGKRTATLDNRSPTPSAKVVNRSMGMGIKRIARVMGRLIISNMSRSGIKEIIKLTSPVPTDDMEKEVWGM